ncbi:calcium-binding protein E63-1 isoform X2 [Drosophila virilis]|nr:calcium-binding protein E63-1 isoform X2 [Drosophila virilis]XP_032291480.1 calcium-binding protein E63-1 isoform X2 [Drosophila virilis]XP_032291481.1 calcium-binding protein E63-1 isoform X2 [Drosophila virilis]
MLGTALLGKRATKPVKKKPFTDVEINDLRTAFDLLDRNRDGRVTANELQFMLKNLGINVRDEIIHDLIREASHSGNGLINEAEFLQWVGRIQALRDDQQHDENSSNASKPVDEADDVTEDLIAAFRVFDRDGNGFITRDELQTAMEMIGEPLNEAQLEQLLAIADLDQDGRINYEEFTRLLL